MLLPYFTGREQNAEMDAARVLSRYEEADTAAKKYDVLLEEFGTFFGMGKNCGFFGLSCARFLLDNLPRESTGDNSIRDSRLLLVEAAENSLFANTELEDPVAAVGLSLLCSDLAQNEPRLTDSKAMKEFNSVEARSRYHPTYLPAITRRVLAFAYAAGVEDSTLVKTLSQIVGPLFEPRTIESPNYSMELNLPGWRSFLSNLGAADSPVSDALQDFAEMRLTGAFKNRSEALGVLTNIPEREVTPSFSAFENEGIHLFSYFSRDPNIGRTLLGNQIAPEEANNPAWFHGFAGGTYCGLTSTHHHNTPFGERGRIREVNSDLFDRPYDPCYSIRFIIEQEPRGWITPSGYGSPSHCFSPTGYFTSGTTTTISALRNTERPIHYFEHGIVAECHGGRALVLLHSKNKTS